MDKESIGTMNGTLRYEGEFLNGMKHGRGTFWAANGEVYRGHFWKNMRHGHGQLVFPGGHAEFTGNFKNNMSDGPGTISYSDGDKEIGTFHNDKRHGNFEWHYASGAGMSCEYRDDQLVRVLKMWGPPNSAFVFAFDQV